jgi:hypothetical protein
MASQKGLYSCRSPKLKVGEIFGRRGKKKVQFGNIDHSGGHLLASGAHLLLHKTGGQNEAYANVSRLWNADTFGLCGMSALRQKSRESAIIVISLLQYLRLPSKQ